jgi:ABC-type Zn uptake system ZnuABC Zn-binding protein ZnuA
MQDLMGRAAPNARRLSVGDRVPSLASSRPSPRASNLATEFSADAGVLSEGSPDPYVWLDPTRAALMVKAIAEEMARADPSRAAGYRRRSEELTRSLEALDRELESRAASWGSRSFIPFRPVFAYLAERYHLEIPASVVGPAGAILSASREREIQEVLRTDGIRGVFREPQLPPEPALHLGEQAGVPVGVLDALGGEGEADSYERLLRFDMDALEKVLKAAPVQPFKGEK